MNYRRRNTTERREGGRRTQSTAVLPAMQEPVSRSSPRSRDTTARPSGGSPSGGILLAAVDRTSRASLSGRSARLDYDGRNGVHAHPGVIAVSQGRASANRPRFGRGLPPARLDGRAGAEKAMSYPNPSVHTRRNRDRRKVPLRFSSKPSTHRPDLQGCERLCWGTPALRRASPTKRPGRAGERMSSPRLCLS